MSYLHYHNNTLHLENVSLAAIAEEFGTPVWCYSATLLAETFKRLQTALKAHSDPLICYAVKANPSLAIISTFAKLGGGADIVSTGELKAALKAGVSPHKIVFSGVGKTEADMTFALETGIYQFNAESIEEIKMLNDVAGRMGKKAPLGLRVNPDVDAKTHHHISTGKKEDKFGIAWADAMQAFKLAKDLPHIDVKSITVHIGSQITTLDPFEKAYRLVLELKQDLERIGIPIERLDLGGGLGITYENEIPPTAEEYAQLVKTVIGNTKAQLIFEPGRFLTALSGVLLCRVTRVKTTPHKQFVVVNSGLNELVRPAIYQAYHGIYPVTRRADADLNIYDVVGPICESTDFFAKARELETIYAGDLLAVGAAGAYGAAMSSNYNMYPLAAEVMVKDDQVNLIRQRQDMDDLFKNQRLPSWA